MFNNSKILIELDKGGCKTMRKFTNDPGGGGWDISLDPGTCI